MIEPMGDRVLIKPNEWVRKTPGGLVLATLEEDKQDQGVVVSVGDGAGVSTIKKGEMLIYEKYGPANVKEDKEKFVIVNLDQILAKVTNVNR
jgi:chaperonin GroES